MSVEPSLALRNDATAGFKEPGKASLSLFPIEDHDTKLQEVEPGPYPVSVRRIALPLLLHLLIVSIHSGLVRPGGIIGGFSVWHNGTAPEVPADTTALQRGNKESQPLPDNLPPISRDASSIPVVALLIPVYLFCMIDLFWQGRWRERYLLWVRITGLTGLVLGTGFVGTPASLFLGVLPIVLDVCVLSCFVADNIPV
ncbi:hypothetical protein EDB81DRAFT_828056 [Dactylonectria macrodidyma]|uniref:Uncharacterized protein n=1 Tax=Dactylonectria macrodidyma TaxID=307937 RepID=A0A9P9D4G9_9HYPO|nr:hypothetical protein EDB81DRAFT_828056 [Dactylonectria macrodidyma]